MEKCMNCGVMVERTMDYHQDGKEICPSCVASVMAKCRDIDGETVEWVVSSLAIGDNLHFPPPGWKLVCIEEAWNPACLNKQVSIISGMMTSGFLGETSQSGTSLYPRHKQTFEIVTAAGERDVLKQCNFRLVK